tara:strand:- start:4913 stop:6223 length:1311 start_codon:yes stop_codon:yes gene_type:complete
MIKALCKSVVVGILTVEAQLILWKYKPSIIAVTGSVGKTSTKDAIYAGLRDSLFIRKSQKSFNSEIGIPLTIIGCETGWSNPLKWFKNILSGLAVIVLPNHYPKWLILEIGADAPGDIEKVTRWIKPDVTVITSLPDVPVHVEAFSSPKEVIREKLFLAKALKKNGTLVMNGDDKNVLAEKEKFSDEYVLLYGMEPHNDVAASGTSISYDGTGKPVGMRFSVDEKGSSMPIRIFGRLGQQQVYPIVATFAVARALEIAPLTVAKSLASEQGSPGRMRILHGYNNTTIIDDSYNSSPTALRAALATLKKVETSGRKIAILGDMLELGSMSDTAHKKAGVQAAGVVDELILVGEHINLLAAAAHKAGFEKDNTHIYEVGKSQEAGRFVRGILQPHDVVLGKGSQTGIRIERSIKEILRDPMEAKRLLVRQDDEWKMRK